MQRCDKNWWGNRFALGMYVVYFVLFAKLLLAPRGKRVIKGQKEQ